MKPLPPVDIFDLPKSVLVTYPMVMHHVRTHETLVHRSNQLFHWVREGKLKIRIGGRYPLAKPPVLIRTSSPAVPPANYCWSRDVGRHCDRV